MISLSKRFLFVHVPKTGGNSIQSALRDYSSDTIVADGEHYDGVEDFELRNERYGLKKHSTLRDYRRALPREQFDGLFKFAAIRNPWDLLVSFYFSPHRPERGWDRQEFLKVVHKVHPIRHYIVDQGWLSTLTRRNRAARILFGKKLTSDIDHLMKFERLEQDFRQVCDRLGIEFREFPHRNRSERAHYSEYYDDELASIVARKFSEEIRWGGYEFERA
jgi:hypothetical protein